MIRAGKLRHQVELQSRTGASDGMGDLPDLWETYATVWCSIEPVSGQQVEVAKLIEGRVTHQVRMRYHPDLGFQDRIRFGGRYLYVKDVRTFDERGAETIVMAEERR